MAPPTVTPTELTELAGAALTASGRVARSGDSLALAVDLGLAPKPRERIGAALVRDIEIHYDRSLEPPERQRLVAREIARWVLRQRLMEETDANVLLLSTMLVSGLRGPLKAAIFKFYVDSFVEATPA